MFTLLYIFVILISCLVFIFVIYLLYVSVVNYESYRNNKGTSTPLDNYIKFELLKEQYKNDNYTEHKTLQDYMVSIIDPDYRQINSDLTNIDDIVTDSKNISKLQLIKLTEPNIKKQVDEFINSVNTDNFKSNLPVTDYNNLKRIIKKYY